MIEWKTNQIAEENFIYRKPKKNEFWVTAGGSGVVKNF